MIRITPQHIYALRDSTGKPFTDLLDRLIRSSAAILAIPPSDVLDNPRINYPDGGVDTQVNKGGQQGPWDYFRGPTTWQYKAVELEELTDSKAQTLLRAALEGDEDAADTGIEFVVFVLMRARDSDDKLVWLQTVFEDQSLDVVFGLLEQAAQKSTRLSHWFSQLFARILPANPDRATSILIQMMQSDSYETSQTAAGLFASVAAARPQQLMDGIGTAVLSKERSLKFLFRKFPITLLPEGVVIQWLEKHGLEGARLLARHVPGRFMGTNGPELNPVTRFWRAMETTILSSPVGLQECTAAERLQGRLQTIWNNAPRGRSRFSIFRLKLCGGGRWPRSSMPSRMPKALG